MLGCLETKDTNSLLPSDYRYPTDKRKWIFSENALHFKTQLTQIVGELTALHNKTQFHFHRWRAYTTKPNFIFIVGEEAITDLFSSNARDDIVRWSKASTKWALPTASVCRYWNWIVKDVSLWNTACFLELVAYSFCWLKITIGLFQLMNMLLEAAFTNFKN